MKYKLVKQIRDIKVLRRSFIKLAEEVFDLSFENWYQNGFWTDKYIPYVLIENGRKVVANVSVNIIDTVWENTSKCYIQLGTVMTDPEYRNRGFSSQLIREIISEWREKCDAIYLFANSKVLNFYPKFGFIKAAEYQYSLPFSAMKREFRKLEMSNSEDNFILKKYYERSNPFSAFPMNNNYELLMFYCSSFMKEHIYYSKKYDTVCIAIKNEDILTCFDIFGSDNYSMEEIIFSIGFEGVKQVVLGFTPKECKNYCGTKIKNDDTLFVLNSKENLFINNKLMFPLLSHA
ncbi:GNAT family N-acetyltransferase [Fusobacterium varium]|uniref:GNAT family N-acetyltransferase n=1 Tax=Fusobacterium varium TaxID=856 RepID=UPI003565AF95